MGGGKETPRQKMVGLMYLVLMALLAMNVSKEIINAFVTLNNKLESYIKFYDNVFPEKLLSNFYRICKDEDKFHKGEINKTEKPEVNEKIRKTLIWDMKNISSKSLTEVHWANFLAYSINETSKKYSKEINVYDVNITDISYATTTVQWRYDTFIMEQL